MSQSGPKGLCVVTQSPSLAGCSYELTRREQQATLQFVRIAKFHNFMAPLSTVAILLQGSLVYPSSGESPLYFFTIPIIGKRLEAWIQIGNHRTHENVISLSKMFFFKAFEVRILLPVVIIRLLIDAAYDTLYYSRVMPCHDTVMMHTLGSWRLQTWTGDLSSSLGHWSVEPENELAGKNLLFCGFQLIFCKSHFKFKTTNIPINRLPKVLASAAMIFKNRHPPNCL